MNKYELIHRHRCV